MNLPRYSLDNRKVIFFFLAILLVGGIVAFTQLGKKEDSPFVIKSAAIVTRPARCRRCGTNCAAKS